VKRRAGEFQIVEAFSPRVIAGSHFAMDLDAVEKWAKGSQEQTLASRLSPLTGDHEINLPAAAAGAHKPFVPFGDGHLGAVALGHLAGVGLDLPAAVLDTIRSAAPRPPRRCRASSGEQDGLYILRRRSRDAQLQIGARNPLLQKPTKSSRECPRLISDFERDVDDHSWIEIVVGEGRRFEPTPIEPEPHILQYGAEIVVGSDPHLSNVHEITSCGPSPLQ